MRKLIILLIISTILAPRLRAQEPDSVVTIPPEVSLLTCAPGSAIYELEGHSGLRLRSNEYDVVVNWGLFDFASPNFVYRFVKGETDYMAGICPTEYFLAQYLRENRRVTQQTLRLSPQQALKVKELAEQAVAPANRVYRYNYVRNNCATKPINVIETALEQKITFGTAPQAAANDTWRAVMRRYHNHYPWYQFGIDLALGTGIDFPITNREQMFAPASLMTMMATATITDSQGKQIPLVEHTEILNPGAPEATILPPTPWYLTPIFWCNIWFVVTLCISCNDIRRHKISRWFDTLQYGIYGMAGCIIAFLVFISVHEATTPNYLILWLNPLCLLVPALIWNIKGRSVLYIWQWLNLCGIIAFCTVWSFGVQSGNAAFIPLLLSDAVRAASFIYIHHTYGSKI